MEPKECYLCGRVGYTHRHHVFGGRFRNASERYGCVVDLCPECHQYIHSGKGVETKRQLQCDIQYLKMDENGWTQRDWMTMFGRSWI